MDVVPDLLRRAAAKAPDRVAIDVPGAGATITYGEWLARATRLAQGLRARGVRSGDRVAIAFANDRAVDFCVAYFATHLAGGVNVPLNSRLADGERRRILAHAEARLVLGDGGEDPAALARDGDPAALPRTSAGDLADILYTSGTTGEPKGVACSHANVLVLGRGMAPLEGATFLHAIPLATFAGCHAMQLGCAGALMTAVVMPRFDARAYLDLVESRRPAATYIVPAMAVLLLDDPTLPARDVSSIRALLHGAAPMPPDTGARLQAAFPAAWVANTYGMTEAGGVGCVLPPGESARRPGSVGKPFGATRVRIVPVGGEDGREAPPREVGEVALRSDAPPRTYFRDDGATARTWRDGWLLTGDLGYLDEDGYLYLVDRKKDLIIRGGHNVASGEVEAALAAHPAVREAAAIGVPHRVLGEDVAAFVVPRAGARVDPDELRAFVAERLADYKTPRRIFVADELPRNALGKVLKRDLRARAKQLLEGA